MSGNIYIYIAIVAITSYLIRVLPLTLIRKPIKNRFIRSFLDRKSTRLNSSHLEQSRMPSSA